MLGGKATTSRLPLLLLLSLLVVNSRQQKTTQGRKSTKASHHLLSAPSHPRQAGGRGGGGMMPILLLSRKTYPPNILLASPSPSQGRTRPPRRSLQDASVGQNIRALGNRVDRGRCRCSMRALLARRVGDVWARMEKGWRGKGGVRCMMRRGFEKFVGGVKNLDFNFGDLG